MGQVARAAGALAGLAALAALLGVAGCGSEGAAADAVLRVYVSAPLSGADAAGGERFCAEARAALDRARGRAGDFRVRATCLDSASGGERWRLAAVGANARRATEDTAAVAYLGEPEPRAARFSLPILEAAGIAQVTGGSGAAAMESVLAALGDAGGSADPRDAVASALEGNPS